MTGKPSIIAARYVYQDKKNGCLRLGKYTYYWRISEEMKGDYLKKGDIVSVHTEWKKKKKAWVCIEDLLHEVLEDVEQPEEYTIEKVWKHQRVIEPEETE